MRKILSIAVLAIISIASASAQKVYICKGGTYTTQDISEGLEISLTEGIDSITFAKPQMGNDVQVVFDGTTATVTIPSQLQDVVTCASGNSPDVVLTSTTTTDEVTYQVSGSSSAGSLTIHGEYKLTVQLNGVSLTSTKGAAIDIQCGKRIAIVMKDGTTNSFADAASGSQKACFYTKGHLEISGAGTLNVTGNANHAIAAKEYLQIKKTVKTINILKAANDAIHVGQHFQMNGGEVNVTSTTVSDGIQVEYKRDNSNQIIVDEDNTGGVIIKGGSLNITLDNAQDAKGIKAEGNIEISGGTFLINANSNGSRGMQTDGDMTVGEENGTTNITIYARGSRCTVAEDTTDPHRCMGIKVDGNMTVNAGTIAVYNTGAKSKAIKVGGMYKNNGGTVSGEVDN